MIVVNQPFPHGKETKLPGIHVFQRKLKSNIIIDMSPLYLCLILVDKDGASWLISALFWVLKAVYGFLATLYSIGYHIYS